jgi:hypothetical protein
MHGFDDTPARTFDPLTRSQCVHLLETHSLGRLAWQAADSQQVRPITTSLAQVPCTFAPRPKESSPSWYGPPTSPLRWTTSTITNGQDGA